MRAGTLVRISVLLLVLALALATLSLSWQRSVRVRITTTTSLYATSLLDALAEAFEARHPNVELEFIPVGSGEALRRASMGDACMVLVHAPSLERRYLESGAIGDGAIFAYNYFIVAGPREDPAGIRGAGSAAEAFRRIFEAGERGEAVFVSRGDNSGTHVKELEIWRRAGLDPSGRGWYLETGSGMANTLVVANERRGYVLSDIGTFFKLSSDGRLPNLAILYERGEELLNIYSAYLVKGCGGEELRYARLFLEFLKGEGQDIIGSFGRSEYGRPLFAPASGREDWLREEWVRLSGGGD